MSADKMSNSVTGLCPVCGKENEITGVTPEDIESDRKVVGGGPLVVACEHCGKDNRVRAFLRAKEKRDEQDRKEQERASLEAEQARLDFLREQTEKERAKIALAQHVEAETSAQVHGPIPGTIPSYNALCTAGHLLIAVAVLQWLVALVIFLLIVAAGASPGPVPGVFGQATLVALMLSSVVAGFVWYAAGEAIKAFRDLVINSWYARSQ